MKKFILILLSAFFLSGCGGQYVYEMRGEEDKPGYVSRGQPTEQIYMTKAEVLELVKGMDREKLLELMEGSEASYIRAFTAINGGGTGAMDAISEASLSTNDLGLVFDVSTKTMYFYKYNAAGTGTEDTTHYSVIYPDDRAGETGDWELFTAMSFAPSTDPTLTLMDSDSPGVQKMAAWLKAAYIDGADGSENADFIIQVIKGGADNTEVLRYDESDDRWETDQGIAAATYTADSSISDAELQAIDDGATTHIPVGGGAGSAMVWTLATGTGAPVRAGSPAFTGEVTITDPGGIKLTDDNYLELDGTADGMDDDEYNGIVIGGRNCGEDLVQWDLVYMVDDADPWHKADASTGATEFPAIGLSIAACTDTNEAIILVQGIIRNEGWSALVEGGPVYLSETAGEVTQTAPSDDGDCIQIVGWALSESEIYFDFSRPYALSN